MEYEFTKMHGLGNDFCVFVDDGMTNWCKTAEKICSLHTGVGADGLIIVCKSDICDTRMRIINSDGSEAAMCGNGIRCFSKFVYERGIVDKEEFTVETKAGIMRPKLTLQNNKVVSVTVDMGKPDFDRKSLPMEGEGEFIMDKLEISDRVFTATALTMGVPHVVIFGTDADKVTILKYGNLIENSSLFPERTNADFVVINSESEITVRTWERGCGPTYACGTGSCASVVACMKSGLVKGNRITVHLAKGDLDITVSCDGRVFMTGPAEEVFTAKINL